MLLWQELCRVRLAEDSFCELCGFRMRRSFRIVSSREAFDDGKLTHIRPRQPTFRRPHNPPLGKDRTETLSGLVVKVDCINAYQELDDVLLSACGVPDLRRKTPTFPFRVGRHRLLRGWGKGEARAPRDPEGK